MKHVKNFNNINESGDEYIDIFYSDNKEKIMEILFQHRIDFSQESNYTKFGIKEEDFDEIAEEISKLFK